MKINNMQPVQRLNPYATQQSQSRQIENKLQKRKTDEVLISNEALEMAREPEELNEAQASKPQQETNRTERLNQIKQSIQNGTYLVNAADVAKKIYDSFVKKV